MNVDELLKKAIDMDSSDLHLTVGIPPMVRVHGQLLPVDDNILLPEDTQKIIMAITNEHQWTKLNKRGEVDFSYSLKGLQRFRVNAFRQRNTYSAALRLVNAEVPTYQSLGLPETIVQLADRNNGLILVTGPTGSGKSTTLASMINKINTSVDKHIITLEDPIEYLFRHDKSIVNQREVGNDTLSFENGLRASLREDPDVILVGEMRDFETISVALTAAETGHLVLSSLHTVGASKTIDRIIDVFPPHQQEQIRVQLAMTLQAVISQQLIIKADGSGRVPAVEIMVATPAIRNIIRDGKIHQLNNMIKTGSKDGMQTMDDSLCELYREGHITKDKVFSHCVDIDYVKRILF